MWSTELGDVLITLLILNAYIMHARGRVADYIAHIAILPYYLTAIWRLATWPYHTVLPYCIALTYLWQTVPYCLIAVGGLGVLVIHASFVSMYDMLMQICCALNSYLKC